MCACELILPIPYLTEHIPYLTLLVPRSEQLILLAVRPSSHSSSATFPSSIPLPSFSLRPSQRLIVRHIVTREIYLSDQTYVHTSHLPLGLSQTICSLPCTSSNSQTLAVLGVSPYTCICTRTLIGWLSETAGRPEWHFGRRLYDKSSRLTSA